jgi:HEAT repeat protein
MRTVLGCLLFLALANGAVDADDKEPAAAAERLADVLANIATAEEQAALRLFRTATAEGVSWSAAPKIQAELAAAVWARCTTPSAKTALLRAIESRSLVAAVPTLRAALREPTPETVNAAIDALMSLDVREEVPEILALATRAEVPVRARAAWALGIFRARSASDSLLILRRDADPGVRAQAAFALGRLGLPEHATALAQMLQDPAPGPRGEAGAPARP